MSKSANNNFKNIAILIIVLAVFLLSVEFFGIGRQTDFFVEIPENATTSQISQILKDNKVIGNKFLFKVYSVVSGQTYYPGSHYISKTGYKNVAKTLSTIPSARTVDVTFREGIELREIKQKLVELKLCTANEFDKYARKKHYNYEFLESIPNRENELEGYLFPDTYNFSYTEGAKSIIDKMLSNFKTKIIDPLQTNINDKQLRLDDVIIMASIIEREVADKAELKKVSGVFYNRLNKVGESTGLLESCATVQYVLKERKAVLSQADTKIDSPYNTYMYKGLPVGPIASPGYNAIYAAINPEKTSALYFVADGNGNHYFANTFAEHQNNMRKAGL